MPAVQRFVTVGGRFPYTLGEFTVQLTDYRHHVLTLRLLAQFTRDGAALTIPTVLGLQGGVIDGRVLRAEPDPAAPFGQGWALEDP